MARPLPRYPPMPDQARLADALTNNRLRIVTRVLTRCGYTTNAAAQPANPADSFTETESRLLRSGQFHWRGSWLRRRCRPGCPSPWSLHYWRGLFRRKTNAPRQH